MSILFFLDTQEKFYVWLKHEWIKFLVRQCFDENSINGKQQAGYRFSFYSIRFSHVPGLEGMKNTLGI